MYCCVLFQGEQARNVLKLDIGEDNTDFAIDIRTEAAVVSSLLLCHRYGNFTLVTSLRFQWLNDLEKDRRYQGWPRSVTEMLRPQFPGTLRHIRKNFFNVLVIVDPADVSTRHLLDMAHQFYTHDVPVRYDFN